MTFTSAPQTIVTGGTSGLITLALTDSFGNPATASSALNVTLGSTSSGGTFAPNSPLTIAAGAGTASFTYSDSKPGTPTVTASAGNLTADTQQFTVTAAASSSLSGYVYADANNSGRRMVSAGVYKTGLSNVTITLKRTDAAAPDQTAVTQSDGSYQFNSLPAGSYSLVETQPTQYLGGGKDTAGSLGGQGSTNNTISQIAVAAGQKGTEYDFGEWLLAPGSLSKRLTLASWPATQQAAAQQAAVVQISQASPAVQAASAAVNRIASSVSGLLKSFISSSAAAANNQASAISAPATAASPSVTSAPSSTTTASKPANAVAALVAGNEIGGGGCREFGVAKAGQLCRGGQGDGQHLSVDRVIAG